MKKSYSTNSRTTKPRPALELQTPVEGVTPRPKDKDRIAKFIARAGLGSRRDVEAWISEGRVSVNGNILTSPALNVSSIDKILVDGKPLPNRERTRMWAYHKPRGLVTTEWDPEGRPTVFKVLPANLPRVVSVGRLDINTEGLLLLTNDGALAGLLENPRTGWTRRYRVRAFGTITQDSIDQMAAGMVVEGINYGPIECHVDREKGENVWLIMTLTEGKNREIKNVLKACGLEVSRLIRVSYGPFQLRELLEGEVEEVPSRILQDQLGPRFIADANLDFTSEIRPPKLAAKPAEKPAAFKPKRFMGDKDPEVAPRGKTLERHFKAEPKQFANSDRANSASFKPTRNATGKAARFASAQAENVQSEGKFAPRRELIDKAEPVSFGKNSNSFRKNKGENAKPRRGAEISVYEPAPAFEPRAARPAQETRTTNSDERPSRANSPRGNAPRGNAPRGNFANRSPQKSAPKGRGR